MVEAMAAKDAARFGGLIDVAWNLKKRIDPDSTTEVIEKILRQAAPCCSAPSSWARAGADSCSSSAAPADAAKALRAELEADPPNDRARFFEFAISADGLTVTVC